MNVRAYANQYRQTAVSSAVLDADPHRLISLMFAGLRERLRRAAACIEAGNQPRKGEAISEASLIVGHLDGCLNHDAGGDIAGNLAALYDYLQRRLLEANVRNDASILLECDGLVADIESAWNAISPAPAPAADGAAA
ncbi:flagellar export chaperone FliS [Lysobacter humi (ex Lee et al. 2017)]